MHLTKEDTEKQRSFEAAVRATQAKWLRNATRAYLSFTLIGAGVAAIACWAFWTWWPEIAKANALLMLVCASAYTLVVGIPLVIAQHGPRPSRKRELMTQRMKDFYAAKVAHRSSEAGQRLPEIAERAVQCTDQNATVLRKPRSLGVMDEFPRIGDLVQLRTKKPRP